MPILYVVATPIGNLNDFSPRGVETLRRVGLIAAEDTRVTMKLCQVFDIHTPLTSLHRHNELDKSAPLIDRMRTENLDIALVTDAGTPCISDPGYALVREAAAQGMEVITVPGCCAAVSALSVSGFDTREWAFYGFLPREKKELRDKLREMARGCPIAVVHESPYRVIDLMTVLAQTLPATKVSASCDLTKLHEKTIRGTAAEVLSLLEANEKAEKGEYCLVLDFSEVPSAEEVKPAAAISLEARLTERMLAGARLRDAQEALVAAGEKKNAVKAAALRLKRLWEEENA